MLVTLKIKTLMAMEHLLGPMETNILANIKITNKMEMELLFGPVAKNM